MTNILFVNSVQKQCGVYDYGIRSFNILKESKKYNFIYVELESDKEYAKAIVDYHPAGAIVNYHPSTMHGFSGSGTYVIKEYFLWHEGHISGNLVPDFWLWVDSGYRESKNCFSVPRPLIEGKSNGIPISNGSKPPFLYPVISTFGFAFGSKNMGSIVKMVNDQFDTATIRIHIPRAYYGDRNGEATAGVVPGCRAEMRKPGIDLVFTDTFLSDDELINYLRESNLNIFLYEESKGRGLSSVIDYALSANAPLAINDSEMFRHIQKPEINVANKTLQEIIDQGTSPLQEFRELWSNENFLKKYEYILDSTL